MAKDLLKEIFEHVPNHYGLLGLKLFETDSEKIKSAALERTRKVKEWDGSLDRDTAKNVGDLRVNVSRAFAELSDEVKKLAYDETLAKELGVSVPYLQTKKKLDKKQGAYALATEVASSSSQDDKSTAPSLPENPIHTPRLANIEPADVTQPPLPEKQIEEPFSQRLKNNQYCPPFSVFCLACPPSFRWREFFCVWRRFFWDGGR